MRKNMLKKIGIMVLSTALLATTVTGCGGCGDKETVDAPATEVLEAVVETEATTPETVEETEAVEEIIAESTEVVEETETAETSAYTFTEMNAVKYAKSSVNVRDLPDTDGNRVGGLNTNQQVTITGQCNETGWYRIELNGTVAYVSDKYLVDQKVAVNSNTGNNSNTSASGNSNTADNSSNNGTTDTTQAVNGAGSANTDNSGWADTSSSAPTVDNTVNTSSVDNSTVSTPSTDSGYSSIDASGMTAEDLNNLMGGATAVGSQGGSAGTGVGGDWGGFVD